MSNLTTYQIPQHNEYMVRVKTIKKEKSNYTKFVTVTRKADNIDVSGWMAIETAKPENIILAASDFLDQENDLFAHYERLPKEMQLLLEEFGEPETYDRCEELLTEVQKHGYTFEYGLDAIPINLHKIK